MWAITTGGFVSLVQDNTDPDFIRVRARRAQHLTDTFPTLLDADIIDLGETAPDYRWHARLPRTHVAEAMYDAVKEIDYVSHVKESVAGNDPVMYRAMMACWHDLYQLQAPPVTPTTTPWAQETLITGLANAVADRMTTPPAPPVTYVADLDVADAMQIATDYSEEADDDEVVAALLVLADEVQRLRCELADAGVTS